MDSYLNKLGTFVLKLFVPLALKIVSQHQILHLEIQLSNSLHPNFKHYTLSLSFLADFLNTLYIQNGI